MIGVTIETKSCLNFKTNSLKLKIKTILQKTYSFCRKSLFAFFTKSAVNLPPNVELIDEVFQTFLTTALPSFEPNFCLS